MSLTNESAAAIVAECINAGLVIRLNCPNGDTVTASKVGVLRWGKSKFALPFGKQLCGEIEPNDIGMIIVQNCGRGIAAVAARKILRGLEHAQHR